MSVFSNFGSFGPNVWIWLGIWELRMIILPFWNLIWHFSSLPKGLMHIEKWKGMLMEEAPFSYFFGNCKSPKLGKSLSSYDTLKFCNYVAKSWDLWKITCGGKTPCNSVCWRWGEVWWGEFTNLSDEGLGLTIPSSLPMTKSGMLPSYSRPLG